MIALWSAIGGGIAARTAITKRNARQRVIKK